MEVNKLQPGPMLGETVEEAADRVQRKIGEVVSRRQQLRDAEHELLNAQEALRRLQAASGR